MLIVTFLRKFIRFGTLVIIGPSGRSECISVTESPQVTIRLKTTMLTPKLILSVNFYLAESYVNGDLVIEQGNLRQLLTILMRSIPDNLQPTLFDRTRQHLSPLLDRIQRIGNTKNSKRHVQYHYDLSDEFFQLFLDKYMQYSCGYFEDDSKALDEAQLAKMQHIAAKLRLSPGQRLLDIGSGWGGLADFLSLVYDVHATGITLSNNQRSTSEKAKKSKNVEFHLRDYRSERGTYDRIVSVGMLEHVGRENYLSYFSKLSKLLDDNGIALVHTIGRRGVPTPINVWIRRRIFPGAYVPSLSQLASAIERTGLWILDCENLRLHYASTLNCWHTALQAHKAHVESMFGERFYRAWEFYLNSCELGFRYQGLTVYQLLLGKRPDAAPLTREYIHHEESRLKRETF